MDVAGYEACFGHFFNFYKNNNSSFLLALVRH